MRRMTSISSSVVRAGWGALVGWNAAQNCAPTLAFAQARDVGVAALVNAREVVGDDVPARGLVLSDHPGQIVMAVEHRRALQQGARSRQSLVILHAFPLPATRPGYWLCGSSPASES